jgi:hypothetical protein
MERWWWQVPLGPLAPPRWLRQAWCLVFHWRHFTAISTSDCTVVIAGTYSISQFPWRALSALSQYRRTHGPDVKVYEHIEGFGCYLCQFVWWRRRRYDTVPP